MQPQNRQRRSRWTIYTGIWGLVILASAVAGCSEPPPPAPQPASPPIEVRPLNQVFSPGSTRQQDVLRVMGPYVSSVAMDVTLNEDGTVPLVIGSITTQMDAEICKFPSMRSFPSLTVWLYSRMVLQHVPGRQDITRDACFLFNADGSLLEVRDRVTR